MAVINKDLKPKHICFLIAMTGEASHLVEHFKLKKSSGIFPSYLPMEVFQNTYKNIHISLILNGFDTKFKIDNIGTQPAVLSTNYAIDKLEADLIINAGTAGGFRNKGLKIGDVVLAQEEA